ncbi:hypothetical protein SGLAM104S_10279 [Streptomyces glaucescens]
MIEPPRETMPVLRFAVSGTYARRTPAWTVIVVHALLGLLDDGVLVDLPGQLLGLAVDLLERLVQRHRADRTGELRSTHSRVVWMLRPVDRSMTVSAPQRVAQVIFSTSSSIEDVTAELPMLPLTFTEEPSSRTSHGSWSRVRR